MHLEGTKVLVVGLGLSGLAAVELLRDKRAVVRATDAKPASELPEAAEKLAAWGVPLDQPSPELFISQELIVLSPGVPTDLPEVAAARDAGVKIVGEVELASWFLAGKIIGITGSNGKTTTTALTGHLLKSAGVAAQVGGNIGRPPTAMVAASRPDQWNVFELSSFQLETIDKFHADIAVGLNVTPDHLDRHYTMEAYTAAKRRLFETQQPGSRAVLNADDGACIVFGGYSDQPVWFSTLRAVTPGLWLDQEHIIYDDERLIPVADVPLRGRHNIENVMAASAAAHLAGAELPAIADGIRTFPGVEHRLEYTASINGVDFYNDSKATNVDATLKAIDAFDGRLWVILGGKDKGSDYTPLRDPLRAKALGALLIGAAAPKIAEQVGGAVAIIDCGTLDTAVREAWRRATPGDTVLLAPACASFDQFTSYEHRGREFKRAVAHLEVPRASED